MLVWAARRRVFLKPHLWLTGAALLVTAALLGSVGAAAAGTLALTSLVLTMQAVLAALRLGEQYPESDVPTQFGMNAYDAVRTFDASVRAMTPATGTGAIAEVRSPNTGIHFDDVGFGYQGENRTVFDGLNLTIPVGRSTAIVGVNGAGKTTLIKLLTRLQEPTKGSVRVDGMDVRDLAVDEWRRHIAVIFQDYLLPRPVRGGKYRLRCGRAPVRPGQESARWPVRRASSTPSRACPKAWTPALPGTSTAASTCRAGSGSGWPSPGRCSRCARGRSILVLDEPTANLDVRAEAEFYNQFVQPHRGDRRRSSCRTGSPAVRHADGIVVLEQARVAEQGSHDGDWYASRAVRELFRLQASRFTDDAETY